MTISPHREVMRNLASASKFLVYAVDHHERSALPDATQTQVRVRRGQAADDIASAIKHLALAARWLAEAALEQAAELVTIRRDSPTGVIIVAPTDTDINGRPNLP